MEIIKKETSIVMIDGKATEITISDKRAMELVSAICENNAKGIDLYFNNCELITELRNTNGYYSLGYNSFKELADALFDSGETQAKNMCLIAQSFGKQNKDKSYTILDKEILKKYSATQLLLIRGLYDFNNCGKSIVKVCEKYGITPETTCATLRELTKYEKSHKKALTLADVEKLKTELPKVEERPQTEAKEEKPQTEAKDIKTSEAEKQVKTLEKQVKTQVEKVVSLTDVMNKVYTTLLDAKTDDKTKVKKSLELLKAYEKTNK